MIAKRVIEKVMKIMIPYFDHVIVDIKESRTLANMKIENLIGFLEAHEPRILERKRVQESVQVM